MTYVEDQFCMLHGDKGLPVGPRRQFGLSGVPDMDNDLWPSPPPARSIGVGSSLGGDSPKRRNHMSLRSRDTGPSAGDPVSPRNRPPRMSKRSCDSAQLSPSSRSSNSFAAGRTQRRMSFTGAQLPGLPRGLPPSHGKRGSVFQSTAALAASASSHGSAHNAAVT